MSYNLHAFVSYILAFQGGASARVDATLAFNVRDVFWCRARVTCVQSMFEGIVKTFFQFFLFRSSCDRWSDLRPPLMSNFGANAQWSWDSAVFQGACVRDCLIHDRYWNYISLIGPLAGIPSPCYCRMFFWQTAWILEALITVHPFGSLFHRRGLSERALSHAQKNSASWAQFFSVAALSEELSGAPLERVLVQGTCLSVAEPDAKATCTNWCRHPQDLPTTDHTDKLVFKQERPDTVEAWVWHILSLSMHRVQVGFIVRRLGGQSVYLQATANP